MPCQLSSFMCFPCHFLVSSQFLFYALFLRSDDHIGGNKYYNATMSLSSDFIVTTINLEAIDVDMS